VTKIAGIDFQSPDIENVRRWANAQIEDLRTKLEGNIPEAETLSTRGAIVQLRLLIDAASAPDIPLIEPDNYN